MIHRKEQGERREECRQLVAKLLESRLGKPRTMRLPRVVKEQEIRLYRGEEVAPGAGDREAAQAAL